MERQVGGRASVIETLVADFETRSLPALTPRRVRLPAVPGQADVVIGMRRSGKTSLMLQQIQEQERAGVGRDRLLYLSFEDERLLGLRADELQLVPEAFFRRHPATRPQQAQFYLDEIQNVPGWEPFVRRLLDDGVRVVLSGSSSKLLSREIGTAMRGRSVTTELLPFGFDESLRHARLPVPKRFPPPAGERHTLASAFDLFLQQGGFPAVQEIRDDATFREILRGYVSVVLMRDIVDRYRIANVPALRYLQASLLANVGGLFSVHRVHNDMRSQGLLVSKNTVYEYLEYLEDAYLVFTVPIAASSLRVEHSNPRKVYAVDTGLARLYARAGEGTGHLLENAVFLELRRRGYELRYVRTRSGYEVDFLAVRGDETLLVQSCADLSSEQARERESRALAEALEEHPSATPLVVSRLESEPLQLCDGRQVPVRPAWRFALELPEPVRRMTMADLAPPPSREPDRGR